MALTIPEMGGLSDLALAMENNRRLRGRVKEVLAMDETTLFSDFKNVDNIITEIMFLWVGLSAAEIKKLGRQGAAEIFIRRYYGAPEDEPIHNNPYFGDRPWYGLFQDIKAKILMQGNGHQLFDGVAYYNSKNNKMVVQGGLSFSYLQRLSDFIQNQPKGKQRGLVNNYLFFIDNTLGLKNMNQEERAKLKALGFIK